MNLYSVLAAFGTPEARIEIAATRFILNHLAPA
jgi:hypothetical protein